MARIMKIRLLLAEELPTRCQPERALQQGNYNYKGLRSHLDEVIFTVSCLTAIVILHLPMDYIDGKPVPAVVFHGHPHIFHAFLVCLMGSCYGSVCSMYLRERKPKIAKFYYFFALVSSVLALAIFFWAAVPASLLWLASKFC
ncbi:hypothetical protein P3X46_029620 [Hevea brasiliensis]|uniref:Phosphatidate cytidylyltransferase n=1 Tax=Hevea brasiliensis TaxID=3981 RepID=A0ABQ9KSR5_HEVBR|nr:hypothetical protein P3X46_029620 [Hevea brasiliensis]